MKKRIISLLLAMSLLVLGGCQSQSDNNEKVETGTEKQTIRITTPNAPNSIPLFYMKENNVLGDNIQLDIAIHKSGQEAAAKVIKGDIDMANFGVQEAANLYNEGVGVRLMDVSTWATFEILTVRDDVKTWEDLKGKKLWIGDKGGPIDYLLQIVLKANNINLTDLEVNRISTSELTQMVVSDIKDIDLFVLREPFISQVKMKNKEITTAFDLGNEYEAAYNIKIPQGGTVLTNEFLESNEEIVALFQEEYKKAIEWIKNNPEEAGELGAKYMQGPNAGVLASAVKNMDMEFHSIEDSKEVLETYFNLALEIDSTMLEGVLPDEGFYEKLFESK
ncbi:MAG: ABC transporter substrate-binding protein [Sedimentibacter sp.]|uniref:ABC transporter substrate-binding protein n=1 Tax=Sedimentibacter sp. TaxID=1960295 RepID=UPI002980ECF5|nr:ABC transporter substrate-binding protein [Sedimentibacter sp.]MDW5298615.1 ABC transporter substrate-binding protein [Sedimentibacter sp.]